MEVVIKKLSPELENDYIEFFDRKAFTDDYVLYMVSLD